MVEKKTIQDASYRAHRDECIKALLEDRFCSQRRAAPAERTYAGGMELLVIEGSLHDEKGSHGPLSWLRIPVGESYRATSAEGCILYKKTGALPTLRSGS